MTDLLDRLTAALADRYALGRGGMAVVFLAQDRKLGRPVALKVLRPELAAAVGAERFLREIEIAARLTHPNILALFDCGEADGLLYYAMPFVEGESLRDRLNREKQLSIDDALQITKEVADALGHPTPHSGSFLLHLCRRVWGGDVNGVHCLRGAPPRLTFSRPPEVSWRIPVENRFRRAFLNWRFRRESRLMIGKNTATRTATA
jgi:hypothetical protein